MGVPTSITDTTGNANAEVVVVSPVGRELHSHEITMRILCNADMHKVGTIATRVNYTIRERNHV